MGQPPIYTTEPMITRALAAEIRHDPGRFVELLRQRTGRRDLGEVPLVRCEGIELIDVELTFGTADDPLIVGIEAKLDHALTREQVDRQLARIPHVVVLLPDIRDTPSWVHDDARLSSISWAEALGCFNGPRLTEADIASIPLQKRHVERHFQQLPLIANPLTGWFVSIERNGAGLPAILMTSPRLPDGRELRCQLQMVGRSMPQSLSDARFEYFLGVSIEDEEVEFPDPATIETAPAWITSLRSLRDEVIADGIEDLLIDTSRPGTGRSLYGKRKLQLITKYAPDSTWIAKGYRDWALGVKSKKVDIDRLDKIAKLLAGLAARWFEVEFQRQQDSGR